MMKYLNKLYKFIGQVLTKHESIESANHIKAMVDNLSINFPKLMFSHYRHLDYGSITDLIIYNCPKDYDLNIDIFSEISAHAMINYVTVYPHIALVILDSDDCSSYDDVIIPDNLIYVKMGLFWGLSA